MNPRDLKVELAKRIITDFHSSDAAQAAEDEFNRIFRSKEIPDVIETREVKAGVWPLPQLLVETGLAESKAEARRLIEQGGVRIGGVRQADPGLCSELNPARSHYCKLASAAFFACEGIE